MMRIKSFFFSVIVLLYVLFTNRGVCKSERAVTIYLDEYRSEEKYIPTLQEVDRFVREEAETIGDEILDICYKLEPSGQSNSLAWQIIVLGHEVETDFVYSYHAEAEVFMNELFLSRSLAKGMIGNVVEFNDLYSYYKHVVEEKRLADLTLQWTDAYGPYFSWDIFTKYDFFKRTGLFPYHKSIWLTRASDIQFPWTLPPGDKETIQYALDIKREEARNAVIQKYGFTEEQMDCFIEDIRCINDSYSINIQYWMKAYLGNDCYWIPFCEVMFDVMDIRTNKMEVYVKGLEKEMIPYMVFRNE